MKNDIVNKYIGESKSNDFKKISSLIKKDIKKGNLSGKDVEDLEIIIDYLNSNDPKKLEQSAKFLKLLDTYVRDIVLDHIWKNLPKETAEKYFKWGGFTRL